MNSISWRKLTGWSGVAFVVIFLASELPLADTPALEDSAGDVRQWFEANTTQIAWTTWGVALAVGLLFLLFASGLRSHLEPADANNAGVWSRLSFASAITMVAIAGGKAGFWAVLTQEDVLSAATDATVKTLSAIELIMLGTIIPWVMAVFLLGASVVILQSGIMAKWLGWLGLLAAVLFVIGSLWLVTGDEESVIGMLTLVGYVGFLTWTVGAAISLIRSDTPSVP